MPGAMSALSRWMTAGEVSASVRVLVKGVSKAMIIGKLRMTAVAFFAIVFFTAGLGAVAWSVADDRKASSDAVRGEKPSPASVEQPRAIPGFLKDKQENWPLSLPEAIRIGLDNSGMVRVVSRGKNGTPYKIAPLNADADTERFKSELMAHVRSVAQQYWNLAQAHVQLWGSDRAVSLAQGILNREQAELAVGRGTIADVAEAAQRLEQFNLDLVTRTSDVITTERQLRNILGLPPADSRRIIPVTAPTVALVDPDWKETLATMLEKQPDIVRQKSLVKQAEAAEAEDGMARQERARAFLEQVIRQTTHSLARFFLEIDANYKQYKTASRLRAAAALRLDSQRAQYDEGRITIDRFLDAVSQYATAVATEAQYKTAYNISIVALEEAKGTLLEHEQVSVVASSRPATAVPRDTAATLASHEPQVMAPPPAPPGPIAPTPVTPTVGNAIPPKDAGPSTEARSKTVSFHFTIGTGPKPIEIRGSFAISR